MPPKNNFSVFLFFIFQKNSNFCDFYAVPSLRGLPEGAMLPLTTACDPHFGLLVRFWNRIRFWNIT